MASRVAQLIVASIALGHRPPAHRRERARLAVAAGIVALLVALLPAPSLLAAAPSTGTATSAPTTDAVAARGLHSATSPAVVAAIGAGATAITAGRSAGLVSAAGSASGAVYTWGAGAFGSLVPVAVTLPGGVTAVAVSEGSRASYALGSDGNVYAWVTGINPSPQVKVSLPGVAATAVSAGYQTALAIGSDGSVYAWGNNDLGQLGNGTTTSSSVPVKVSLPGGVSATVVSEGFYTSVAVGSDGSVYAWGYNSYGQLGNGTTTSYSDVPVKVSLPGGVAAVAVSEGVDTTLAIGSDGNIYAWGDNFGGKFGDGTNTSSNVPVKVSLPAGVAAVAVSEGGETTLAIGSDGNIYASGRNSAGEFGDGTTTSSNVLVKVSLPGGVAATAVSESKCQLGLCGGVYYWGTSLAVGSDGNVYGWGKNDWGQLGNGTQADSLVPVRASLPNGVSATGVSEDNGVSLAVAHFAVIRASGIDRFQSSATVSAMTFAPGVARVYIAYAYNFPDALAAAAAAGTIKGPVLLVNTTLPISPYTLTELSRLKPKNILVVGGTGSVSDAVLNALKPYTAGTVTRASGIDRFQSSATVSALTFAPGVARVYIAYAYNFPDALAAAAAAGTIQGPVLLVNTTLPISPYTLAELTRLKPKTILVVGGPGSVSAAVFNALIPYAVP
jgi:alpha-tubulin suppressor-like RCC1 family protein/putative cell wall-binding protein